MLVVGDDGENANADDVLAALRIEYRRAVAAVDDDAAISNAVAGIDQPKLRRRWWLEEEIMPMELMVGVLSIECYHVLLFLSPQQRVNHSHGQLTSAISQSIRHHTYNYLSPMYSYQIWVQ